MEEKKELWERLTKAEESTKSAHQRLDSLEKLVERVYVLANETKNIREDLNSLAQRVSDIESKPGKRYDAIIAALISSVVGLIVGRLV